MPLNHDVLVQELVGLRQQQTMIADRIGWILSEITKPAEEKEDKRPVTFGSRTEILENGK